MDYVLRFDQCSKEIVDRVGGKCASLGSLIDAGAKVPPGFSITTDAWRRVLERSGNANRIEAELRGIESSADPRLSDVSRSIRMLIDELPIDQAIESAIRRALDELSARHGCKEIAVAVRSSATAEDLPSSSFAGLHDTGLWIVGADAVLRQVRRCWSSLYSPRAIAYRIDNGFSHEKVFMAVGVQKMVNARAAGVAFTLNPANGDRSKVAIDSSFGIGEAVVSGEVTPDHFLVDKVIFEVVKRVISKKHIEYVFDATAGTVVQRRVEPTRQDEASLTHDEVIKVAKMAKFAESHFQSPQDIEWAIERDADASEAPVFLQSRPETVWSHKPRMTASTGHTYGMAGMVQTLIRGVKLGTTK